MWLCVLSNTVLYLLFKSASDRLQLSIMSQQLCFACYPGTLRLLLLESGTSYSTRLPCLVPPLHMSCNTLLFAAQYIYMNAALQHSTRVAKVRKFILLSRQIFQRLHRADCVLGLASLGQVCSSARKLLDPGIGLGDQNNIVLIYIYIHVTISHRCFICTVIPMPIHAEQHRVSCSC